MWQLRQYSDNILLKALNSEIKYCHHAPLLKQHGTAYFPKSAGHIFPFCLVSYFDILWVLCQKFVWSGKSLLGNNTFSTNKNQDNSVISSMSWRYYLRLVSNMNFCCIAFAFFRHFEEVFKKFAKPTC